MFFFHEWHMSADGSNWQEFYLSGKVGPCEYGMSANEFLGSDADPAGMQKIIQIPIIEDGTELSASGTGAVIYTRYFRTNLESFFKNK